MPCKQLRGMYLLDLVDHALYLCRANNLPSPNVKKDIQQIAVQRCGQFAFFMMSPDGHITIMRGTYKNTRRPTFV